MFHFMVPLCIRLLDFMEQRKRGDIIKTVNIRDWIGSNKVRLNPSKMELLFIQKHLNLLKITVPALALNQVTLLDFHILLEEQTEPVARRNLASFSCYVCYAFI